MGFSCPEGLKLGVAGGVIVTVPRRFSLPALLGVVTLLRCPSLHVRKRETKKRQGVGDEVVPCWSTLPVLVGVCELLLWENTRRLILMRQWNSRCRFNLAGSFLVSCFTTSLMIITMGVHHTTVKRSLSDIAAQSF